MHPGDMFVLPNSQSQLGSSSSALAASKEGVKRLEMEVASMKRSSEAAIGSLQGQYSATVKALEKRV